jgi:hypothetical protein
MNSKILLKIRGLEGEILFANPKRAGKLTAKITQLKLKN